MNDMNKCVFLDRDGTINKEVNYLSKASEFKLLLGVGQAIRLMNDNFFKVIVITNQSGIARGYLTEETLESIHSVMKDKLAEYGAHVDGIYYCPHHPDGIVKKYSIKCGCRKPEIGLILEAAREHMIDLECSYVIGDKKSDILLGKNAGCKTILVKTGYGSLYKFDDDSVRPDYVGEDLIDAARWMINNGK